MRHRFRALVRIAAGVLLAATLSHRALAQTYTVCADFACGTFDAPQQIDSPPPIPPHPIWHMPPQANYAQQVRQAQAAERLAQAAERRRQQREAALRRQLAWQRHLNQVKRAQASLLQLQQLEAVDRAQQDHDEQITADVDGALSAFERERRRAEQDHIALLEKLQHDMDHMAVPAPDRRYIPRVLFLGVTGTPAEALQMWRDRARDPFDGQVYNGVFGFGWSPSVGFDLLRAGLDHALLMAGLGTVSERAMADSLASLTGSTIGELVCHSNGCAIAESLIAQGVIQVKELRMLGGDGTLMDLDGIARMAERSNTNVDVYATLRDPVPLVPQGWAIREWVDEWQGAPRQWILNGVGEHDPTYQVLGLANTNGAPAPVRVNLLSAPGDSSNVVANHGYPTYAGLVNAWRLSTQARR